VLYNKLKVLEKKLFSTKKIACENKIKTKKIKYRKIKKKNHYSRSNRPKRRNLRKNPTEREERIKYAIYIYINVTNYLYLD